MSKRQLDQYRARIKFERVMDRLRHETRMGLVPRRHLDDLVDHLETLLGLLEGTVLHDICKRRLDEMRELIRRRHTLRLVRHAEPANDYEGGAA